MAVDDQKTVVVEKDRRSSAPVVAVVVVVVLVLVALFGLPYLTGSGGSTTTNVNVAPTPSGQ